MLTCENCGEDIAKQRPGLRYCSNVCQRRAANKRYYARHCDRIKADRLENPLDARRRMLARVKSRAKRLGIPFDLDIEDFSIPERCPVLGFHIKPNSGRRRYFGDSPSLDRIEPSKGYVKGNVRVISARANLLKSDATVEELRAVLSDLERLRLAHF